MAMELCEQIERGLGETVSATLIWGYPTIDALVDELLQRMTAAAPASNGDAGGEAVSALASAEPAELSDDELVALVSAELELLEDGDRDG